MFKLKKLIRPLFSVCNIYLNFNQINNSLKRSCLTKLTNKQICWDINPIKLYGIVFLSAGIYKSNENAVITNSLEIEKKISMLIIKAENYYISGDVTSARLKLNEALVLAEKMKVYSNIAGIYDLLATIAFREGSVTEAEEMLVRFIEKLIQLGYPDDHNSIIRFKLKLSRLYQIVGNSEMAEIGFRNCIDIQEKKITNKKLTDELTNVIYLSTLFWYGRFLTEQNDFEKARVYMKKTLTQLDHIKSISPSQVMVILYHSAEISFKLKDYDESISYLVEAITICKEYDKTNSDFPIYLVKLGIVYLFKGINDKAEFWCENGRKYAKQANDKDALMEAEQCLKIVSDKKKLDKIK